MPTEHNAKNQIIEEFTRIQNNSGLERSYQNRNVSGLKSSEIYNNTYVAKSKAYPGSGFASALGQFPPSFGARGSKLNSIENAKSLSPSKNSIS